LEKGVISTLVILATFEMPQNMYITGEISQKNYLGKSEHQRKTAGS